MSAGSGGLSPASRSRSGQRGIMNGRRSLGDQQEAEKSHGGSKFHVE